MHVSVCICTFRRADMLRRLLGELARQTLPADVSFSVIVADNDAEESARAIANDARTRTGLEIHYRCEPRKNIALVRNAAIAAARGDFVAFIDDDEFPVPEWLARLLETAERHDVSAVLGPVRPHFDRPPPRWVIRGRFFERREHPTGTELHWSGCRTGNVLLRRTLFAGVATPFDERFGTGGEDVDFFHRMSNAGHHFVWCNEAVAYETVPMQRCTRRYLLHRALLRGQNSLKISAGRGLLLLKSCIALPLYALILPFSLLAGQHHFMSYCIRSSDHVGRLLAWLHLAPVRERQM